MVLGDFADYLKDTEPSPSVLLWLLFVAATFIIVIIMLNLLIAIISDTYDMVMSAEKKNSNFEMA